MSGLSERVDFGDFYKFSVSLGLILIFSSIAFPWLVVKDASFLDYKPVPAIQWTASNLLEELSKVPPAELMEARRRRIGAVGLLYKLLPWVCGMFFSLGLSFLLFGLRKWWMRQVRRDKKENKEIDDFLADLPKGSASEVREKNVREDDSDGTSAPSNGAANSQSAIYSRIERALLAKLRASFGAKYHVYRNRKLGSTLIDGLMVSKSEVREDLIIEVKVIRSGFKSNWLNEVLQSTARSVDLYEFQFDRLVRGVVVIVVEGAALDWVRTPKVLDWIAEKAQGSPLVNVRVVSANDLRMETSFNEAVVSALPQVSFV